NIVEVPRKDEAPFEYVKRVARTKAAVGWHRMGRRELPPQAVLAADTDVVGDGAVLGKPDDAAGAASMLERLSGRTHEVAAAVAIRRHAQRVLRLSVSRVSEAECVPGLSCRRVTCRRIGRDEIDPSVPTGEPFDKAGAYAIQGRAA